MTIPLDQWLSTRKRYGAHPRVLPQACHYDITVFATHALVCARGSGLCSTFRSTNGKVNLGHVLQLIVKL